MNDTNNAECLVWFAHSRMSITLKSLDSGNYSISRVKERNSLPEYLCPMSRVVSPGIRGQQVNWITHSYMRGDKDVIDGVPI